MARAQTGPVAAPPATVVQDNDTGNGQKWGRAGGRTITYTIGNFSSYSALTWGVPVGSIPGIAFDGAITSSTPEQLTYDQATSDPNNGIARFLGSAQIAYPSVHSVPTRLTITVTTTNNVALPITYSDSHLSIGVDLFADAASTLTVNLKVEANNGSAWAPLLDYYDGIALKPAGAATTSPGPVMSELSVAFFYTASTAVATDPTVTEIANDTDTLITNTTDLQTSLGTLGTSVGTLTTNVNGLGTNLTTLTTNVSGLGTNLSSLTDNVTQGFTSVSATIAGLLGQVTTGFSGVNTSFSNLGTSLTAIDGSLSGSLTTLSSNVTTNFAAVTGDLTTIGNQLNTLSGQIPNLTTLQGELTNAMANLAALQTAIQTTLSNLSVSATRENALTSKSPVWLVQISYQGQLVTGTLASAVAIIPASGSGKNAVATTTQDISSLVTVTPIAPGIVEVSLGTVPSGAQLFQFSMHYAPNTSTLATGSVITQ